MSRKTYYVDVILPLALQQLFTYRVPHELSTFVKPGVRVVVQFGKTRSYAALVRNVHENRPKAYEAKYIDEVLDESPVVNDVQFRFWDWIADYYMCTTGEVMAAALPGSLRLASETKILLNPDFSATERLDDREFIVFQALEMNNHLSLGDISSMLSIKSVQPVVKSMLEKDAIVLEEELRERFKPRTTDYVRLHPKLDTDDAVRQAFDELGRAPKQLELLMGHIHLSRRDEGQPLIPKSELMNFTGASHNIVNALVEKEMIEVVAIETGRLKEFTGETYAPHALNKVQQKAMEGIRQSFAEKEVCLLHGVTGSGKTEIYIELIEEHLKKGEQVLYLLPEIALTAQIITRLQRHFGDRVAVYHSRFNQQERTEIWRHLQNKTGRFQLILGARSSMFLPFHNLGLVVVDEEHDSSYKQYNPAPRYYARDAAIVLAAMFKAKVLLGSATPSLESVYNANRKKYGLVELTERFGGVQLPEILVADIKKETKDRTMKSHFSSYLLNEIEEVLKQKQQVILFQNRRGYASLWNCETCGWTPECAQCDVSLTYHKHLHLLICHYCGNRYKPPPKCGKCGSAKLSMLGFGTEKIEDQLPDFFPGVRVARLDYDTTRSKNAYHNLISRFESREIDILVGTQMVTKGLDFDNVALVGVMNADSMLNFPDFRAFERAFQMLTQVAGRAGRKGKRGKVIIQTWQPYHWIVRKVIDGDFNGMAAQELAERRQFKYPPFHRMVSIVLRHRDRNVLDARAQLFAGMLRQHFADRLLGPEYLPVARVKNKYQKQLILKLEKSLSFKDARRLIRDRMDEFYSEKSNRSVQIAIDVDPV